MTLAGLTGYPAEGVCDETVRKKTSLQPAKAAQNGLFFGIIKLLKTNLPKIIRVYLLKMYSQELIKLFKKVTILNDRVRLFEQIVEQMNKAPLQRALKRTGHGHRTNPVAILKVILYSAMEHKYECRLRSENATSKGHAKNDKSQHASYIQNIWFLVILAIRGYARV